MPNDVIRVIFIGDVIGRPGRRFLGKVLPLIKDKLQPDLVIANGENAAGGLGIIKRTADEIFSAGVDIISGGNHIWDKKEALSLLDNEERILRPLNYPEETPGRGCVVFYAKDKTECLIINLQGRVFMEPVVDNPFLIISNFLRKKEKKIILVDFHAEATAEKQAMAFYLDGKVSAILGTHTHVQTADNRILANGTAFQTDIGMTGSFDSIIGIKKEPVIKKFLTGINHRFEVAKENIFLDMTLVDIDKKNGKALKTEIFKIFESTYENQLS